MHLNNNGSYLIPKLLIALLKSSYSCQFHIIMLYHFIMLYQFMSCLVIGNEIGDSTKLKPMSYNECGSWSDIGTGSQDLCLAQSAWEVVPEKSVSKWNNFWFWTRFCCHGKKSVSPDPLQLDWKQPGSWKFVSAKLAGG